jgi:hypothetical protein
MDNGVPSYAEYDARIAELEGRIDVAHATGFRDMRERMQPLINRAKALVRVLDDREKNHGSLIGPETLTARNELALELSKWGGAK